MSRTFFVFLTLVCSGCQGQEARIANARQSVESVRATTTTVVGGWLEGDLSDHFAGAAVQRARRLAEETRTKLVGSPQSMADRRAAALTRDCEDLSRLLAQLGESIERGDRAAARLALINVSPPASFREEDR